MKRILAMLLTLCLLLGLAACGAAPAVDEPPKPDENEPGSTLPPDGEGGAKPMLIHAAADNSEIFEALNAASSGPMYWEDRGMNDGAVMKETAEAEAPTAAAIGTTVQNDAAADDYSKTNVQVQGVDEGDIVKTDGKYIYVLRQQELLILSAAGADSQVLFRKTVGVDRYETHENADGEYLGSEGENRAPQELYILGDRLVVLYGDNSWNDSYDSVTGDWSSSSVQKTIAEIYDVSDPAAPVLRETFAQDGDYRASRLAEGQLYVLSDYWVYDADADVPESYIPRLYTGAAVQNMPADCIWIPERGASSCYTVVSGLDVASGSRTDSLSILGGCDTVYMTSDRLYIASSSSREEKSEPRTESVYTVTDYSYTEETALTCISLTGNMTVSASGKVAGYLLNQFSMDEYKGYLRLVTTESGYSYTVYEDEARGFVNYDWPEEQEKQTNGLYVLDGELNVVGSLTGLAEEERVYSVRFDGDTGYFVTFRQVDPLFAVDLSAPTAPKMLSALKIPGFSEYLHVYGEGRLLGLGMNADEETGRTGNMKLSMFDTSDPANVTEKYTLTLTESWSEALYNHRAILVSPEKDIIAFPAGAGYEIYGYSDAEGFCLRSRIEAGEDFLWSGDARGLYIGDMGYVVLADRMWVLDLTAMTTVCDVAF